jgi:hypothetical protein
MVLMIFATCAVAVRNNNTKQGFVKSVKMMDDGRMEQGSHKVSSNNLQLRLQLQLRLYFRKCLCTP